MRRRAWQHMMDLPRAGLAVRQTHPSKARQWVHQAGGYGGTVGGEWPCTGATHPRHMAALYNIQFTT